jgi:DNA-binding phage protein
MKGYNMEVINTQWAVESSLKMVESRVFSKKEYDEILHNDFNPDKVDQFIILGEIANSMLATGISREFVASVIMLAFRYEGVYDLMVMWSTETDSELKDEIIADLQEEIDESSKIILPKHLEKKDYLHFDNLDEIAKNVMAFKKNLKAEIERWGGVSKLAKETGIPQASLSRLLNSPSLPRRSTLEKIAKAMNLQESYLLSRWQSP